MSLRDDGLYEAALVCEFIASQLEDEKPIMFPCPGPGRKRAPAKLLNGQTVTSPHHQMLKRWAARDTVPLAKVDAFLHRYGVMIWELEDWATQHYGRSGYVTPAAA